MHFCIPGFLKKTGVVSIASVLLLVVCTSQKFSRKEFCLRNKPELIVLSEKQTWKRTVFHNAAFPKVSADRLELGCRVAKRGDAAIYVAFRSAHLFLLPDMDI